MVASLKFGVFFLLLILGISAKQVQLIQPRTTHLNDPHDTVRLAISESINAHLVGALGYDIQYIPQHSGQCTIKSVRDHFNHIASRDLKSGYYSSVSSIITLKQNNLTVLIDTNLNIAVFEIVNNTIQDRIVNRTLQGVTSTTEESVQYPLLVTNENQSYILAVTNASYYFINVSSLKAGNFQFQQFKQSLGQNFVKLQIFDDVLFVATREAGIKTFSVDSKTGLLNNLYTITNIHMMCEDFAIERKTKILYLLDFQRGIEVYNVSKAHQKPTMHDFIDLSGYTRKNQKVEVQNNVILVAFFHRSSNSIAQIHYNVDQKKFSFLRYFKFKDALIDLKLMNEHLIAIGDVFVAVFPVNIHPKLIQNQMNGNIVLSPIRKVLDWRGSQFIGLTYNSITLGQINVQNSDQITCTLKDSSKLKKLIYRANITSCGSKRQYYDYCTYTKQVNFQKMQVITGEGTANGLWIAIIVLCVLIIIGFASLQIIKQRKEKKIKFLEAEFQKRKEMSALPSQRLSHRIAQPVPLPDPVPFTDEQIEVVE